MTIGGGAGDVSSQAERTTTYNLSNREHHTALHTLGTMPPIADGLPHSRLLSALPCTITHSKQQSNKDRTVTMGTGSPASNATPTPPGSPCAGELIHPPCLVPELRYITYLRKAHTPSSLIHSRLASSPNSRGRQANSDTS